MMENALIKSPCMAKIEKIEKLFYEIKSPCLLFVDHLTGKPELF